MTISLLKRLWHLMSPTSHCCHLSFPKVTTLNSPRDMPWTKFTILFFVVQYLCKQTKNELWILRSALLLTDTYLPLKFEDYTLNSHGVMLRTIVISFLSKSNNSIKRKGKVMKLTLFLIPIFYLRTFNTIP